MTTYAIRIPTHVDAAFRIAAHLAEPVANERRIKLDLTLKTDTDGTTTITETITAIPSKLTLERTDALGEGWVLTTYEVLLEAGDELTEAIVNARLDAPPTARTDPLSGALRALELELLLAEGTTGLRLAGPYVEPSDEHLDKLPEGYIGADPVPASDQD